MTVSFDRWIADLDTQTLADMSETERVEISRFLERRGFSIGPEADCVFCGCPGAFLRDANDAAGHWHCPPFGSPARRQRFADLTDNLLAGPDFTRLPDHGPCVGCGNPTKIADAAGRRRHPRCVVDRAQSGS